MAATIKDIAKKTGLGYATISAFLNGVTVRPKNKEAIEHAIEELGYVRNEYARGLKTHKSMTIGVLIPELNNVFSTTIISEMEDTLRSKGYGVLVCDCKSDAEIEQKSLQFLMSKMVDGLIIMPISTDGAIVNMARQRDIPVVVIDRMTENTDASYVVIDNKEVASNAIDKILAGGHRRIALISGGSGVYTARERHAGYKAAAEKYNCYDRALVYNGELSISGGYLAMKKIAENHDDVTAVFTTNYEMSIGAIIAINELGKKIPDDYSFLGFDNQGLSQVFSPCLATINQPLAAIGHRAAGKLMDMMNGGGIETIVLIAEFNEGGSIRSI